MSLLGKLFSGLPSTTGGTSTSRPTTAQHLESGVEDRFTYDLLFPNPEALCHNEFADPLSTSTIFNPSATNAFDYNGEIDLDVRDVRIIIMQEATPTSGHAYLLYDSHAPPPASSIVDRFPSNNGSTSQQRVEGRRSISAPRKISAVQNSKPVVIQQESSAPRGAFDRRPPTHAKGLSYTETESQRAVREHKEELSMLSNCIFGVSEVLAYKGIGTKVHILPSDSKHSQTSSSYQNDANGSFGRSSMRSSRLAQSYTSENVAPGPTSAGFPSTSPTMRGSERKRVLITRMFPVPLPNDDSEDAQIQTPTAQSVSNETAGYPFPKVHDATGLSPGEKKPQPKQKRTPMYAVGMIVHLPAAPNAPSAPVSRSSFRGPGSYTEQDSFPSSFNSARRAGWTMLGTGFGVESLDSSYTSDVDDRIDIITPHWDIIMRTLSHLQAVATAALLPLLRQADVNSPDPRRMSNPHKRAPSASVSISGKRVVDEAKPFKIHKTNSKMVQLTRDILMQNQTIHKEVDASRQRIVYGIKARQVSTGQGRWGIWREQARLVGKWAGGKEQGFFFFNLLTGFLGNHTEWLQALGPSWYRRRHYQQQRATRDEDMSLPARTIIVSDNKMSARRLIFLLAAFLPANQQAPGSRFHRPSTSASFGGFSQSPPNYHIPRLREESLRHKINKRPSRSAHSRSSSFATQVNQPNGLGLSGHLTSDTSNHDRRVSDAASIKTANLPIPGSDISTRKSSTAATSTATPVPTLTHFSRRPVRGTGPIPRPGSSGSLATDDLLRSLKRGDSTYSNASSDSQQNSRWGSMISGLWGSKRRDSGQSTDNTNLSVEGLEINDPHYPTGSAPHKRSKLAEMVQEAERMQQTTQAQRLAEREVRKSDSEDTIKGHPEGDIEDVPEQSIKDDVEEQIIQTTERIPDPSGAYESPVKTSINDDGVIDIDIPMPDFLSFETAVSSPSSSGYLSTPGFAGGMEGFEHYSRAGPDSDTTINVGGWLQRYHPDFALQAVPSHEDLVEEIKASMRAEPTPLLATTPNPDSGRTDRWVDISSAIIADTTNFTIKRIRYRRLVKLKEAEHPMVPSISDTNSRYGNVYGAANLTPSLSVYDSHIEERFIEEPIISMDETLIEAVERIIAQSGEGSKATSVSSSRSNSRKGGARERSNSASEIKVDHHHHHAEVPRNECKKMVLSALEEIVKEVAKSREEGADTETESFLREGVRSWLDNVETME